jgi:two-component system, OmpR family, phosphate regulon response regulator PhoB
MTRILLVEDSNFVRLAAERALTRAGYDVITAADGECALQTVRKKRPDLILLDMLLPKISGPDVLKALKSDPGTAGIPVVVLTGLSNKNEERLRNDGAFAFLSKEGLGLDKGSDALLLAVTDIARMLNLKIPAGHVAAGK